MKQDKKNQRGCISAYAASFRRNEATIRAQENCYKFWILQQFLVLRASLAVTEQLAKTGNQSLETTKKWITNMARKLAQFQSINLVTSSARSEIKRKARVEKLKSHSVIASRNSYTSLLLATSCRHIPLTDCLKQMYIEVSLCYEIRKRE